MSQDYKHGQEIGEIKSDIKNVVKLLETHIQKQDEWNEGMDKRVRLAEQWIQTTTGKVIILTTLFGIVGSIAYIVINWGLEKLK